MAELLAIPKATAHVRSISLPSGSHPLTVSVDDHLCRLKASQTSTSTTSICHTLDGLKNLYERVNDLLQLPLTQQAISNEQPPHNKWAEEVLDGSLRLLDVCSTARDVLLQTKESAQQLQSSLRRRSAESGLSNEVSAYMVSRKKVNKMVTKCITNLNFFEKNCTSPLLEKDSSLVAVVSVLREVEAISLSTMKSLLCSVPGTKARSNKNGWSLVSKMMQPKRITCETEEEEDIGAFNTLNIQKLSKDTELVKTVMKQLETSELAIQELEDGLESVYRCLVKSKVKQRHRIGKNCDEAIGDIRIGYSRTRGWVRVSL